MDAIIQFGYDAFGVFLAIAAVVAILFIVYILGAFLLQILRNASFDDVIRGFVWLISAVFVAGSLFVVGYIIYGLVRSMQ